MSFHYGSRKGNLTFGMELKRQKENLLFWRRTMSSDFGQTEMAYNIEIRGKAQKAIRELRDAAGAKIKDISMMAESNELCFLETMKVVRAYLDIIQSLRGGF